MSPDFNNPPHANRRPIKARGSLLAKRFAQALSRTPVSPNAISMWSVVFAILGAMSLMFWPTWGAWGCVLAIQLRLLCNLFDGMVAVEGGKSTPSGVLFNEVPDRLADSILLIALGYVAGIPTLGWACALLAVGTAYIRTMGGSLGQPQVFTGPMAKQQRMAIMTVACLLVPVESYFFGTSYLFTVSLWVILLGSVLTCCLRLHLISRTLGRGHD